MQAIIKEIIPNSVAAELELEPGDQLIALNGVEPLDFIDYLMLSSEENLNLTIEKPSGEQWEIELEKDADEPLGINFEEALFDGIRPCQNHCLFCFVHQLPGGHRSSLYIQDDDYRLSFLQGGYITLTNLTEADWQRIIDYHLSPLYVSVHATDSVIRRKLLGCKAAGNIKEQLQRLRDAGITVHTQAVLCPGINDGPVLEQTIRDLAELWPAVASIAVVPVGLTGHREHLYSLRPYTPEEAMKVLEIVTARQKEFLADFGTRLVFPADEWYIISGRDFPPDEAYEDYLQLDNGVGLIRWFLTEFSENFPAVIPEISKYQGKIGIITGESAVRLWQTVQKNFQQECPGLELEIYPVTNGFLGSTVTVTGLLGGQDIIRTIRQTCENRPAVFLLPQIMLKQDQEIFIDDVSLEEVAAECMPQKIAVVPSRASAWLNWLGEHVGEYL